jgi:hypothetical protein
MPWPKLWDCKRRIEMEDHAMSFIRNGYAVRTGRGFLGVLFSASLALALFGHDTATAQEVRQIKVSEKQIQSFMAAYEDIAKVYTRLKTCALALLPARRKWPRRHTAECSQQIPPSDGDCHTPLPREVRKEKDTTQRACCPLTAQHPARGLFSLVDDSRTGYPPRAWSWADGTAQC